MTDQDHAHYADEAPARRALNSAVPSSFRGSLIAQARERIETVTVPHDFLGAAPGATVGQYLFAPSGFSGQRRLEHLEATDRPFATQGGNVPIGAGDYALSVDNSDDLQLSGIHARASIAQDFAKFILLPGAGIAAFGAVLLALSGKADSVVFALTAGGPLVMLVVLLVYYVSLIRRGAVTGAFLRNPALRTHDTSATVADIRRYYLHARAGIAALKRSRAWHSEVLAAPRVQINLDEEAAQLADFALRLEKFQVALGERPDNLGDGPLSLWESRRQIYLDGVASLGDRAEAIVSLTLAVDNVETRLHQLEQLQSSEAEDLAGQIVRSMPANEIAAAHTLHLTANAAGVAHALRDELTMLTATADELARAAAQIPQFRATEQQP